MLIATAGHIDHGKTALVRALTGVETDRLPDEKARGISIDLGFAYWPQADGSMIGFVDVPGHERFVRNMVAGICGIDLALIIVAADDGVMPQTIEHVQILDLLGVPSAVVAINKCDRVDANRIADVRSTVEALLEKTRFASAPHFEVSALTGEGIDLLADALKSALSERGPSLVEGRNFRLAVDRVFSVTGVGTVACGTVLAGTARVGDRLVLSPSGKPVRVRGIQSAGREVGQTEASERCALNLAGIELAEVHRGDCVIAPDMLAPTSRIEAWVKALGGPLKHNSKVHFHLRTAALGARVLIPKQVPLAVGAEGMVQLILDGPTSAVAGESFIIRDASGRHLIGGGKVIDPLAPSGRGRQGDRPRVTSALRLLDPSQVLKALGAVRGFEIDADAFEQRFNLSKAFAQKLYSDAQLILLGKGCRIALPSKRVDMISQQLLTALSALHIERPDLPGLPIRSLAAHIGEPISVTAMEAILRDMSEQQLVSLSGSIAKLPGHAPGFSPAEMAIWSDVLNWREDSDPVPFTLDEAARETRAREAALKAVLYRRCVNGDLYQIDPQRFLLSEHLAELTRVAAGLGPDFSAAEFRDASGIGRNMVIRILEFLDASGITTRNGDLRRMTVGYTGMARFR